MSNADLTLLIGPLSPKPNGLNIAFRTVVDGFLERGLNHKVINTKSNDISRQIGAFSFKRSFETLIMLGKYWWYLLFAQRVYLLIGLSRVSFFRDFLIIWSAFILQRKVILHVHSGGYRIFFDTQPDWGKRFIIATLKRADHIIILGELLREQFDFLPQTEEKMVVVPNCAPFDSMEENPKRIFPQASAPIQLLYMSNLIETKGYLDLLAACQILYHEKKIPLVAYFCGEAIPHAFGSVGKTAQEILDDFFEHVRLMGLQNVVEYCGIVSGEEKNQYFKRSHILVLPTYYPWEGQPISILEALAFSMPVISTHFRGIPEQVIDTYNGFLVKPHAPVEVANAIENLWNNPKEYSRMSVNASQFFQERFTRQKHLERLLPVILG